MSSVGDKHSGGHGRRGGTARGRLRLGLLLFVRWAATTNWFLFLLAGILAGGSLMLSVNTGAWHWFQRSGALLVSIGAVLSTRRPLELMLDVMIYGSESAREREMRRAAPFAASGELRTCVCGFGLVAMGTLIWAYGDLIGCIGEWHAACLR